MLPTGLKEGSISNNLRASWPDKIQIRRTHQRSRNKHFEEINPPSLDEDRFLSSFAVPNDSSFLVKDDSVAIFTNLSDRKNRHVHWGVDKRGCGIMSLAG